MKLVAWILSGLIHASLSQKEFISNGTHRILVPDTKNISPEVFYDYVTQGQLDGNYFLPGASKPLKTNQIRNKLGKLIGEDPYDHEFYTIKEFPDKKIPVDPSEIFNPLTCLCTDIKPQTYLNENPELGPIENPVGLDYFPQSCAEAAQLGFCENTTFIMETMPVVVPEGFCERSCGRCDCCESVAELAAKIPELSLFLQISQLVEIDNILVTPATQATILAPSNEAMEAALEDLGIQLEEAQDHILLLREFLLYHILPPHPYFRALWTTPFFIEGEQSETLLSAVKTLVPNIANIAFFQGETNETYVVGPQNFALVTEPDIEGCKAFLNVIDTVLLPFDPETVATLDTGTCRAYQGVMIKGSDLGEFQQVGTPGECCQLCEDVDGCTGWEYCVAISGCTNAKGDSLQLGDCQLRQLEDIEAPFELQSAMVGFISGSKIEIEVVREPIAAVALETDMVPTEPKAAEIKPTQSKDNTLPMELEETDRMVNQQEVEEDTTPTERIQTQNVSQGNPPPPVDLSPPLPQPSFPPPSPFASPLSLSSPSTPPPPPFISSPLLSPIPPESPSGILSAFGNLQQDMIASTPDETAAAPPQVSMFVDLNS